MTPLDRLLVWITGGLVKILQRRFSQENGRVFHITVTTNRPVRLARGTLLGKHTYVGVGFGAPNNVIGVALTREQSDHLATSLAEVTRLQDNQYAIVEEGR